MNLQVGEEYTLETGKKFKVVEVGPPLKISIDGKTVPAEVFTASQGAIRLSINKDQGVYLLNQGEKVTYEKIVGAGRRKSRRVKTRHASRRAKRRTRRSKS
jgi:hypothetical protein